MGGSRARRSARACSAAVLLLLTACGDDGGTDPDPMEPSDTPPTVVITAPAGNTALTVGQALTLQGTATDLEDGTLPGDALRWSSDVDGDLGSGASVVVDDLSLAEHRIVLSATDSDGRTGSDSVQVSVTAPEVDRALTEADAEAGFVVGQVLLRYAEDPVGGDVLEAVASEHGLLWHEPLPGLDGYVAVVEGDADATEAVAAALAGDDRVAAAGVDALAHAADVPGDFDPEGAQSHLLLTGMDVFWRGLDPGTVPGVGVTVAVIDHGFDVDAGDLETGGRALVAPAFVPGPVEAIRTGRAEVVASDPADNAHGTHVSSLVAGGGEDGDGFVGLAPGAAVMPIRVASGGDRFTRFSTLARALEYAAEEAPEVVLLPLAADPAGRNRGAAVASGVKKALEALVDAGVQVVVPAGNCAAAALDPDCLGPWMDVSLFGTLVDEVWTVGATDASGAARWERSGVGTGLDLVAPGVGMCAPSSLGCPDGSSFASAVVAGLVALHRSLGVTDGLSQLLRDHTVRLDVPVPDEETGYGRAIAGIGLDALDPPSVTSGVPTAVTLMGRNFDLEAEVWIDGEPVPVDPADRSPGFDAITVEYTGSGTDPVPVQVVHPRGDLVSEVLMLEVEGGGGPVGGDWISPGDDYTCALRENGTMWCWGENTNGVFGNGGTADSGTPVRAGGSLLFRQAAIAPFYEGESACGIDFDGRAWCWGNNDEGETGSGTMGGDVLSPGLVSGGLTWTDISMGEEHVCAIAQGGVGYCWGENNRKALGDGTLTDRAVPTLIAGDLVLTDIASGNDFTCALDTEGAAWCWGQDRPAEEETPLIDTAVPEPLPGGLRFTQLSAGDGHACGLVEGGAAYCWGGGAYGQLGNGSRLDTWSPVEVSGGLSFRQIAPGGAHTCAVTTGGAAWCWGEGEDLQLGDGVSTNDVLTPVAVAGGLSFAWVAAGEAHSCGVTNSGDFYCWGDNDYGKILGGGADEYLTPVLVPVPAADPPRADPGPGRSPVRPPGS